MFHAGVLMSGFYCLPKDHYINVDSSLKYSALRVSQEPIILAENLKRIPVLMIHGKQDENKLCTYEGAFGFSKKSKIYSPCVIDLWFEDEGHDYKKEESWGQIIVKTQELLKKI